MHQGICLGSSRCERLVLGVCEEVEWRREKRFDLEGFGGRGVPNVLSLLIDSLHIIIPSIIVQTV